MLLSLIVMLVLALLNASESLGTYRNGSHHTRSALELDATGLLRYSADRLGTESLHDGLKA